MARVGVAAVVLLGVGVPAAQAVEGAAPTGPAAAATVKINVGQDRACSGALVDSWWVLTAKSCFVTTPGEAVPLGKPAVPTTVTIGRADLTTTAGHAVAVDLVVPHADRDVALVRLATEVTNVPPVVVAATAPVVGEALTVTGYGRTATQWVPDTAHAATYTVSVVDAGTLGIQAQSAGATICKGDAGGPALRSTTGGGVELVAIHHTASQGGCHGSTTTAQSATETRVDDLRGWLTQNIRPDCAPAPIVPAGTPNIGDGQLVRVPSGKIFIVAGGGKYELTYADWAAMGLRAYTDVSQATVDALRSAPRDNTYLRDPDGTIHRVVSGARYGLSQDEWIALGKPGYVQVPAGFIANVSAGAPGGPVLLHDRVSGVIHQVVGCTRYPLSLEEWQALGSPAYLTVPSGFIARVPVGVPTSYALLRDRTTGGIYQTLGGAKYVLSPAEYQRLGSPAYTDVPAKLLGQVTGTVPSGSHVMRDVTSGAIYRVEGGKKRLLTPADWDALADKRYVDVPPAWLGLIPQQ
ncbi:esterase [Cellulomonas cellasea DSM 20118]|uniref:Esterase n=1 Tax=Cellulomonas cellasea DSM 20118 TaxID=1408250 RepID=A0A0A0BAU3_9CELL|nr:esterase [Cellulomonas cellasea DSM 20118]